MYIDIELHLSEVQRYILASYPCQSSRKHREQMLIDWGLMIDKKKEKAYISKYVPGIHFYALDEKFLTYSQALEHLEKNGYKCAGLLKHRIPETL